jgi:peroxiredoxin
VSSLIFLCFALTWILLCIVGFVLLGALRNHAVLSWRVDQLALTAPVKINRNGLKLGANAPGFALPDTTGKTVSLEEFAGRSVLLVFTQTGCGPCKSIIPALEHLQKKASLQIVVVNRGDLASTRDWAETVRASFPILTQEGIEVAKKYEAFVTPFAFLIDESGVVVSRGLVTEARHIDFILSARG